MQSGQSFQPAAYSIARALDEGREVIPAAYNIARALVEESEQSSHPAACIAFLEHWGNSVGSHIARALQKEWAVIPAAYDIARALVEEWAVISTSSI